MWTDTVEPHIPCGSSAVDPWPTASGRPESEYARNTCVTVEANCVESRDRDQQHMWTNYVQEPVWRTNADTHEINAMMREIEFLTKEVAVEQEKKECQGRV